MEMSIVVGSGSGSVNETFSCKTSDLNPSAITDREHWSLRESVAQGGPAIAFLESLILCVALGWNLFIVITYILKYKKLLKEPANVFLFSLAITDILICVMVIPFTIVAAAAGEFVMGDNDFTRCKVCFVDGFFFIFLTSLSLYFLTMLSVDRCMHLVSPLNYKKYCRPWHSTLAVIISCIMCFAVSVPPAFGFGQWEFNRNFGLCLPRWLPQRNLYYTGMLVVNILILIFILSFTNIWTLKIVSVVLKSNFLRQRSFRATQEEKAKDDFKYHRQQRQLVKVFGALFLAYIISWSPIVVMFIVVFITRGQNIPDWIFTIGWFCYLLNPMAHPMLESFFVMKLRLEISRARKSIRRASVSLLRKATQDVFKNIELPYESPDTNKYFRNKSNSLSAIPTTQHNQHLRQFRNNSTHSLSNAMRGSSNERRNSAPQIPSHNDTIPSQLHPNVLSFLPRIDELETMEINGSHEQHVIHDIASHNNNNTLTVAHNERDTENSSASHTVSSDTSPNNNNTDNSNTNDSTCTPDHSDTSPNNSNTDNSNTNDSTCTPDHLNISSNTDNLNTNDSAHTPDHSDISSNSSNTNNLNTNNSAHTPDNEDVTSHDSYPEVAIEMD